jgi:hypothetical protein
LGTKEKLSDLDYCYACWELLKKLEKNVYARNECVRKFRKKANAKQSIMIGLLSLILPIIVWLFLLLSPGGIKDILSSGDNFANFGTRLGGLLMLSAFLFIIIYMLLKAVWDSKLFHPLKKISEKSLSVKLVSDVQSIDKTSKQILNMETFQEKRIPEQYLSAEMMPLLIRYFESGQATFMKEAVYSLKLDLQNTGYYENVVPKETLLQKERLYLADELNQLEKQVEGSEQS